jgi:hypothetical protein
MADKFIGKVEITGGVVMEVDSDKGVDEVIFISTIDVDGRCRFIVECGSGGWIRGVSPI